MEVSGKWADHHKSGMGIEFTKEQGLFQEDVEYHKMAQGTLTGTKDFEEEMGHAAYSEAWSI